MDKLQTALVLVAEIDGLAYRIQERQRYLLPHLAQPEYRVGALEAMYSAASDLKTNLKKLIEVFQKEESHE